MFLILPMGCVRRLPIRLRKLGHIPGNRPPITPQTHTMIDRIMGGKEHVVGKTENVLRHNKSCGDGGKTSRGIATWRVAEELTSKRSALIRRWIKSMDFHSQNPCHPLGIRRSDFRSIVLVILIPMTYVFQLSLSSYLSIFVIRPTFVPILIQSLSVRPTFTPSLIHPYLIYGVFILS